MKHFYSGTFMNQNDLKNIGINYPVKLEYYKTVPNTNQDNQNEIMYGIEVIKTAYKKNEVKTENIMITKITKDELIVNKILDILRRNEVTPICAEYVVEDLIKEIG